MLIYNLNTPIANKKRRHEKDLYFAIKKKKAVKNFFFSGVYLRNQTLLPSHSVCLGRVSEFEMWEAFGISLGIRYLNWSRNELSLRNVLCKSSLGNKFPTVVSKNHI